MTTQTGHCLCGAVKVTFAPESQITACHCEMCRRWTSGAFVEVDTVPGSLKTEGPVKTYRASEQVERGFCGECGSTIFFHFDAAGHDLYSVSAGLLENAGGLKLEKELYADETADAFAFAGDHLRETRDEHEAKRQAFLQRINEAPS
ncbi:GFA family protein [Halovulum sp. GXIMD14793]